MKKRVVLLRSNPVSPDPPVEKVADTLLANGYEVCVIGWDRNGHPSESNDLLMLEHGKANRICFGIPAMFDGGIKKNLIPLSKFQARLFNWLKKHRNAYDIIHAFDFDTGFIASKIARKYNKALIYHILDFYVDSHTIPSGYLKSKVKSAEFSIINNADATIICTEKRREQIKGATPKKLEIIHNTPKAVRPAGNSFSELRNHSRCKIVYVGILAGSRFLREIIRFVEQDDRFEFHIGGFGIMENEVAKAAQKCDRIFYYGKLPYDKTLALEQSCDLMTAIYDPKVPNHQYAAPNKFYESLMLGKPVIMARNTGFDDIIESHKIGCLMDYTEQGLADGLNTLLLLKGEWNAISAKMQRLYTEEYSWSEMARRLLKLYEGLCNEEN